MHGGPVQDSEYLPVQTTSYSTLSLKESCTEGSATPTEDKGRDGDGDDEDVD